MKNKNCVSSILFEEPKQKSRSKLNLNKSYIGKYFLLFSPVVLFFIISFSLIGFSFYLFNFKSVKVLGLSVLPTPVYNVYNASPKPNDTIAVEIETVDARSAKIEAFFNKYGAPLAPYSKFIVNMADKYEIDWRLVSAIGYCEGNGGKKIPEGSFNTWGWGASEHDLITKSGKYNLGSWENAIETVSKGLKKGYIDQGLNTPFDIMLKYAPQSINNGGSWAKCVESYMHEIDNIK